MPPDRRAVLDAERRAAADHVAALEAELAAVHVDAEASNLDDEHDPDGATVGFERAAATSLLDAARRRLEALDEVLARLDAGEPVDRCRMCGGPIGDERLAALPDATTCVACAAPPPSRFAR